MPRRELATALLRDEARVLPALQTHLLPMTIPQPRLVCEVTATSGASLPAVAYALVEGQTLCRARPTDRARVALAAPLGRFLRALHGLPADVVRALAPPADTLDRADLRSRVDVTRERLGRARAAGIVFDADHTALDAIAQAPPPRAPSAVDCVVHGDLYARHMIVDADHALTGVIDWGDVHLGDRALDLAAAWLVLPASAHAVFRAAYGSIDDVSWARARFRAVFSAAATAVYGHDIGDDALVNESRGALGRLAGS